MPKQRREIPTSDEFQLWLFMMSDELDAFAASLPNEVGSTLDYSIGSLNTLESWLLAHYASPQAIIADVSVYNRASRYFGQVLRQRLSSKWLQCVDRKNGFYGRAVVQVGNAIVSPHSYVSAAMDRRTGHYLHDCVQALADLGS